MSKYNFCKLTLISFFLIISSQSCISTKEWGDKYLLVKNEIKGNKEIYVENLSPFLRQKPNRRLFSTFPYLWIYQFGKKFMDSAKVTKEIVEIEEKYTKAVFETNDAKYLKKLKRKTEKKLNKKDLKLEKGNWLMRVVGEEPSFFDLEEAKKSAESLEAYMANKGFFQGKVTLKIDTNKRKKRVKVSYLIEENLATVIRSLKFLSSKKDIDTLLNQNIKDSEIKIGKNYDYNKLGDERVRIEKFLKNRGYYTFNRQYVDFKADTSTTVEIIGLEDVEIDVKKRVDVRVIINNPTNDKHKIFALDTVFFYMPKVQIDTTKRTKYRKKLVVEDTIKTKDNQTYYVSKKGITYVLQNTKRLRFSSNVLDSRVKLVPKEKYSQFNQNATQRALASLNMFKFVTINYDTVNKFNAYINVSPLERYQWTSEAGVNVSQGLPGPFVDFSLKNRNTFGGAEIFSNSFRFAIDGQTGFSDNNQFYSSQEVGFTSSLAFPQVVFPTRLRFRFDKYNPSTKVSGSYSFIRRPEYTRTNLRASIAYNGTGTKGFSTLNLTLSELSYVRNPRLSEAFQTQLNDLRDRGNPLFRSFQDGLVSSMYAVYTYNNNIGNKNTKSFYLRILAESGGTMGYFVPNLPNAEGSFLGVNYFQFFRFNPSFHYYLPLGRKEHQLAFRVNAGISKPTGISASLPYEKFFFAGGSNSVRAWRPRRLGPGSFTPQQNNDGTFDDRFEQPGEIILEANVEYRFPLYSFIKGALFIDAGNVWALEGDDERPGAEFEANDFYTELAIGTGFGMRFNLPFLLLRFDLGIKAYNPARERGDRFVLDEWNPLNPFNRDAMLLNIGIGYPF